jgi:hypothetical protein
MQTVVCNIESCLHVFKSHLYQNNTQTLPIPRGEQEGGGGDRDSILYTVSLPSQPLGLGFRVVTTASTISCNLANLNLTQSLTSTNT